MQALAVDKKEDIMVDYALVLVDGDAVGILKELSAGPRPVPEITGTGRREYWLARLERAGLVSLGGREAAVTDTGRMVSEVAGGK